MRHRSASRGRPFGRSDAIGIGIGGFAASSSATARNDGRRGGARAARDISDDSFRTRRCFTRRDNNGEPDNRASDDGGSDDNAFDNGGSDDDNIDDDDVVSDDNVVYDNSRSDDNVGPPHVSRPRIFASVDPTCR